MFKPKVATTKDAAQCMFNLPSTSPRVSPRSPLQMCNSISRMAEDPTNDVCFDYHNNCTAELPPARTHPPIPIQRVFYRIKSAMPFVNSPTIQEVDDALAKMAGTTTVQQDPEQQQGPEPEPATHIGELVTENVKPALNELSPASTPAQGLLPQPCSASRRKGRRIRKPVATVTTLRRSKRQACSRLKHMPAEQRANYVLCRRLGYIKEDLSPVEQAIQEFIASFQGPMLEFIVAARTAMFRLDDNELSNATEALIRLGGPEAVDGLPELNDSD
ncbi:unnamed protein product [Urochloa humidicola]